MKIKRHGFTLIEVLIVLAILGFVSLVSTGMVESGIRLQKSISNHADKIEKLSRVWLWVEADVSQIVNRPIRDELGESKAALVLINNELSFTRTGWKNSLGEERSQLQRIHYSVSDDIFYRRYWRVLDRDQDSKPVEQLFNDVKTLSIEVLGEKGWVKAWPEEEVYLPGVTEQSEPLPIAVKVHIEMKEGESFERVFEVPVFPHEKNTANPYGSGES
ncbi:type II secretion system minor pseudopilin GspJ [Marinomonas mediterranea]|jgi:general secretion pathway protein J|uniref:Type II secretion system protein J n=1 Tax=Marinomonas mediterranea (strain ATCC 700492 / JCM 21426 / NBRC 103028 / MMB-1) TaxID=717774 RepID=F2K4G8_MARM1|nr:type II secretion system minor pseudopilin GspJ [Marinomonas mediterranea]ADZ90267.1 general secretion pathway protein J [Marinomonas mediterranea MMB-1]WCN16458.1 type II secretion system minor pseudopilin GspJ [Marinomonas mediterranea MMB-1]